MGNSEVVMFNCVELENLKKILDDKKIEWFDMSEYNSIDDVDLSIERIHIFQKNIHFSIVNGFGTYGGYRTFDNKNLGLLELYGTGIDDPIGFLTAEEAFEKMIKKGLKRGGK